jgi:AAA domain-containing protein
VNHHSPVNPYIAGSPVTGTEMFYGREDVFDFIQRHLIGRHRDTPIVLYGQRRTGKTSVLYQLHRHLDLSYRCIFIDLHGINLNGMSNLLLGIANSISRTLRRDHQLTVEVPGRAAFVADPRSAFETMFLDEIWSALGEGHLVLMIDEAVRLDEEVKAGRLDREVFDYLRHLMQHYACLNFIFSLGSGLEELKKDYAFLFSVSLYHGISFLEPAAAAELITQPVRDHYLVAPQAVSKVLQITSGHPYYTQLVCHCMFDSWSRAPKSVMDVTDVDAVLAEAIELGSANLTYVWEDSTPGEQAVLTAMADAMHSGSGPVSLDQTRDAWREIGVVLPEDIAARAVRSLTSREVVAGKRSYSFTVDLQRLWLEKHRRLDWVKDELADAVQQWHESAESLPPDKAPVPSSRPRLADAAAPGNLRATSRGRILAIAAAAVVLASYLIVAAIAQVFPFSNSSGANSSHQNVEFMQGLTGLLPGDLSKKQQECQMAPPPGQWSVPGAVLTLHCTDPGLAGGNVYAYQLDNAADFQTAWRNLNRWWGFLPASAGKACPPTATAEGATTEGGDSNFPESVISLECGMMTLGHGDLAPAYAWAYATNNVIIVAQGASGSLFPPLVFWISPSPALPSQTQHHPPTEPPSLSASPA